MEEKLQSIDIISGIFGKSVKKVIERSTKKPVKMSPTIQKVPKISLRPDVGCFVQFSGDYNGLVVMNYTGSSAMCLYNSYMLAMGIPEEELAKDYTSSEVPDTIGEITNQIMGQAMNMVEEKYSLSSFCGQPKAVALNSEITLIIDSDYRDNRRLVFQLDTTRFYMEIALEATEFITLSKL
ncbi:MAG: DUF3334 family protein [Desulfobacterales bacterium]|nr:DUF3334 family protein [Desulfobacterales bacterium]